MSAVSDFVKGAGSQAFDLIGAESITIDGGGQVDAVLNETASTASYEPGGYDHGTLLTAVVSVTDWEAAYPNDAQTYLRKTATARGQTLRVNAIRKGASFVEVELIDEEEAQR